MSGTAWSCVLTVALPCRVWKGEWPGSHRVLLAAEDCVRGDGRCGVCVLVPLGSSLPARNVDNLHSNQVPYNCQCLGGGRAGAAFGHPAPARGNVHTRGSALAWLSSKHQSGFWQQLLQPQRCYQRPVSGQGQAQASQAVSLDSHCLPPPISFTSGF